MKIVDALFTRADYQRLPEGFPAQLIEGFLVKEPAPTRGHQRLLSRLLVRLAGLVGPDRVLPSPVDVDIDEQNVLQPDLVVLRRPAGLDASDEEIPLLVFEILSPSTGQRDREVKTRHYLGAGVAEVWLVDPGRGSIEVHSAGGVRTATRDAVAPSAALPGFALVPRPLFAPPEA